jgi:hypothetical protein
MAALRPRTASASRSDPFFRAGNFCYRDCAGEPQHAPGGRRSLNNKTPEAARHVGARPAELPFVAGCCVAASLRCCCSRCCCALAHRDSCCKGTTGLEWATRAKLLSTRQVAASLLQLSASTFQLPAFQPSSLSSPAASRHPPGQHTFHLAPIHPSTHPPTQPCPPGPILVVVQPCILPSSLSHACAPCPLLPRPWPASRSWSIRCERTIAL